MKSSLVCAAALLALAAAACPAAAQDPAPAPADSLQELRRADGSRHVGRLVEERGDTLVFETIDGRRLEERRRQGVRVRPARGRVVRGTFWYEDRGGNRLFFGPTARTIREGTGYAGSFWVLPSVGYGVTDDFTLAAGWPSVIAPKLRLVDRPGVQLAAGAYTFRLPRPGDSGCDSACGGLSPVVWHGIAYGVATLGGEDAALHAGAGYYRGNGESETPVMLGGELRLGRLVKAVSENWIFPGEGGAASAGLRRVGDLWTLDFGYTALFGVDDRPVRYIPVLSFSYAFGAGT